MIDIIQNIENHKAITKMAAALEISDNNLETTKLGNSVIYGKDDKPLQAIQHLDSSYYYYIRAPSTRKRSALRNKLISFGMSVDYQTDTELYLTMRRLPEQSEATFIRQLLGIKQKATDKQRQNSGHTSDNFRSITNSDIPSSLKGGFSPA